MFDFSASLNDVAPVSRISLSVDVMRKEKSELLMDSIWTPSLFCFYHPDRVQ